MELKKFQIKVLQDLNRYCELLNETNSVVSAYSNFWLEKNIVVGFGGLPAYNNTIYNTPHVCFKVPTGGGKTFLAVSSLRILFNNFPTKKAKVVVWLVPSEAILTQTLENLSNPNHPYRQKIEADFNGRVQVYSKQQALDGQQFNITTVNEQLSIIVMSFDSLRIRNKDGRKVYQENGNLQSFLSYNPTPETKVENIDDTALIQVLNQLSPVIIVDESHHTSGELSIEMLRNLNPSFILDLTATPRKNSNIISYVDAAQLKAENMVKLPVIVYNRPSQDEVIADAISLRDRLDDLAQTNSNNYIRPIVLFQAQPKQGENKETFEKLKERLVNLGIPEEEIAIKTAEINEIKNIDLLSRDCKIKYIITINALKEGWDCPYAYILATLANKTSTVDVEQILGRVLRLPYTQQNNSKFLNLSYVLTCSNDFNTTIQKVVAGLNNAGFSEHDYRIASNELPSIQSQQHTTQTSLINEDEECLQFDTSLVKSIIEERKNINNGIDNTISSMLVSAEEKSNNYDDAIKSTINNVFEDLPMEVKSKVQTYPVNENFKDEAMKLKLPQFFIKPKENLFTLANQDYRELLTRDVLLDGFTLKDKSTEIDFSLATEGVVEVDVNKNESPKYRRLNETENAYFKEMFKFLPPESRVKNCKYLIKQQLEKFNYIASNDLSLYIDRIVDNMDSDTLLALQKNVYGFTNKIKYKIVSLQEEYQKSQFKTWLELGKIECLPSFNFKQEIIPVKPFNLLSKSLYVTEESMNDFELKVIEKVSSLPNVKWWHRNMDRIEFYINGFINHYPDFIVYTNSGKIVLIETKGLYLASNDDSKDKAELGKIWQAQAGNNYRYYMVSSENIPNNPDAISLEEFIKIMRAL